MFVTWLLSLLLSIPEVAVTFTQASGKRSIPWIQGHVAGILQKTVKLKVLLTAEKVHWSWHWKQTAWHHLPSVKVSYFEVDRNASALGLQRTNDWRFWSLRIVPWIDFHSSSAVTFALSAPQSCTARWGKRGCRKRPCVTSTFLRWDSPGFIFNNEIDVACRNNQDKTLKIPQRSHWNYDPKVFCFF